MRVRLIQDPDEKSHVCDQVLRALPDWFGIESAIVDYVGGVRELPFWVVTDEERLAGFCAIRKHNDWTSEVYVMGVLPEFHGSGVGTLLIKTSVAWARDQGQRFLSVKTLSASHPDPSYARTREFYLKVGFAPVEEFKTLWGEGNPCLLLVRSLEK